MLKEMFMFGAVVPDQLSSVTPADFYLACMHTTPSPKNKAKWPSCCADVWRHLWGWASRVLILSASQLCSGQGLAGESEWPQLALC
jgi:hypothetical protein